MSDMLEALKQVGNNLEEAWANLVQEHFSNPVLQVNYSNLITSASTPSQSLLSCPRSSPSPACPAGFCLADNTIQWRPLLSLQKRFLLRDLCPENSLPCRCCFVAKPIFLSNVNNFGFWNDLINFLRYFVQFVTRAILFGRTTTMTAAHLNEIVWSFLILIVHHHKKSRAASCWRVLGGKKQHSGSSGFDKFQIKIYLIEFMRKVRKNFKWIEKISQKQPSNIYWMIIIVNHLLIWLFSQASSGCQ